MRAIRDQQAHLALLGVLLVAAVLAWPGVHQGFSLYYDEAVHLVTARALARGHGYTDESLPGSPWHRKYPPVLSLILAPFWRLSPVFPENLVAMRLMMLVAALGTLGLSYRYLVDGQRGSPLSALASTAAAGWHGLFVTFATFVSSEMLYALLAMASLLAYARFEAGRSKRWLFLAVAAAAVATATRAAGLALLGALVLHLALHRHVRAALATFIAALAVTAPWQVWGWAAGQSYRDYPPEVANNYVGYVGQLTLQRWAERLPTMLTTNARTLAENWGSLVLPWADELSAGAAWSITAGVLVTLLVGWRLKRVLRTGVTVADLYLVGYLTLVVLWPWPFNERFLLVVAPLLVFPAFDMVEALVDRPDSPSRAWRLTARLGSGLIVAAILLTTLGHVWLRWSVSERYEAMREDFRQMLGWIERQTPPDAVLVGAFDPLYYLMSGRRAVRLAYPDPFVIYYKTREERNGFPEAARLLAWYRQIGACWVVQEPMIGEPGMITYYYGLIQALRAVSGGTLDEVYRAGHGWFAVYRLRGCPA